jgi:hypothetical protein
VIPGNNGRAVVRRRTFNNFFAALEHHLAGVLLEYQRTLQAERVKWEPIIRSNNIQMGS